MQKILGLTLITTIMASYPVSANQSLYIAYPSPNHQTTANKIFLLGTASPTGEVFINGQKINRSQDGHFAPSFPLQIGENIFTIRYQNQELKIKVTRLSNQPETPLGVAFAKDSLTPNTDITRMAGELICFGAVASPNATVSVNLNGETIPLLPETKNINLPSNSAILTNSNLSGNISDRNSIVNYQGCAKANSPGNLGQPKFQLTSNGQTISQLGQGKINIISPTQLEVAEITAENGTVRSGPSTDFSRLTPLPKGTQALITGREGEWLRLDYGAWIKSGETRILKANIPPRSIIRGIRARQIAGATEILFPLQTPVPISLQQGTNTFTLNLYNTTAQTDIIRFDDDPLISRLDWQQVTPDKIEYTFNLKSQQQWGYKLRYEGNTLILTLRHPPKINKGNKPLSGIKILIDPGHGGPEDGGGIGPTGYREKNVTLILSKLVRDRLVAKGATVYMTREQDTDLDLPPRVAAINKQEPAVALSIHYNALPDNGDAINTKGVGTFWYHPQAHSLAVFLHNYLVQKLGRPSYGIYWNNLALTRPAIAPSVLLELGFMINPVEFEWITNPQEQQKLADTLADGITEWFAQAK